MILSVTSHFEFFLKQIYFYFYSMKHLIISLIFLPIFSFSQKIYSTQYSNQSDIKVFVVEYENQSDLKVYKVDYPHQAKSNKGHWYFVEYANQSDLKIHFVEYANQSDLKIYFVQYSNQAGWQNKSKKHLLF